MRSNDPTSKNAQVRPVNPACPAPLLVIEDLVSEVYEKSWCIYQDMWVRSEEEGGGQASYVRKRRRGDESRH